MLKFMKYLGGETESPPEPKAGYKRCSACGNECPLSDFKRRATLLQSRAWTKNPNANKRLMYEGKICNTCHNERKRMADDMSPEAYRKRLVNERVNPLKIQARVEARRARGIMRRQTKSAKTLLKNAMPELRPMFDEITTMEVKLKNKLLHFQRTGQGECAASVFCARYLIMLESVRQQLRTRVETRQKLPDAWVDLIADRFTATLWDMFRAVADEHKQRLAPFMQHIPRTPEF